MNRFRKLGFIEYNGDLEVHNSLLNVVLHDIPASEGKPRRNEPLVMPSRTPGGRRVRKDGLFWPQRNAPF